MAVLIETKPAVTEDFPSTVNNGRFTVAEKIGFGSFGVVFKGFDTQENDEIAIKFEQINSKCPCIIAESKIYQSLRDTSVIPKMRWFGPSSKFMVLVTDLKGPSLYDLLKEQGGKLALDRALHYAREMLKCIEIMHKFGYIHRDIKPENFVTGCTEEDKDHIYLIDFGLTKKYIEMSGAHIGYSEGQPFTGNSRFASINSLKGVEQSRRDDLESLLYTWIYMIKGNLPWMDLGYTSKKSNQQRILESKLSTKTDVLFKDLPPEFIKIYFNIKQLRFNDEPFYKIIDRQLQSAYERAIKK